MTPLENKQVDMKLEVVLLEVSDVDRAKSFYENLGWRLDIDIAAGDFRGVQITPHNSEASIIFGKIWLRRHARKPAVATAAVRRARTGRLTAPPARTRVGGSMSGPGDVRHDDVRCQEQSQLEEQANADHNRDPQ